MSRGSRTTFRLHSVNHVMFRVMLESQGYSDDGLPEKGQGIVLYPPWVFKAQPQIPPGAVQGWEPHQDKTCKGATCQGKY